MAYELQVKAVERRFDRSKFIISLLKNIIATGTTIIPTFLDGVSSIPITSIGYAGYLFKLFFEFLENDQLRQQVADHKMEVDQLINWYNNQTSPLAPLGVNPGGVHSLIFAPTGSVATINGHSYLLCNPLEASNSMFGYTAPSDRRHGAFDFTTSTPWITLLQLALISTAFGTAIAEQIADPDNKHNNLSNGLVLTSLICGAVTSIIDPIEEHLKKANLIRAKDVFLDVIYAIRGGRNISNALAATMPMPVPRNHAQPTFLKVKNRAKEVGEGYLELLGAKTSGKSNRTIQTNAAFSIKVAPNRYRFFQVGIHNHQPIVPDHITDIAVTPYDPTSNTGQALPAAPAPIQGRPLIP
jgi:hypothetical protein